MLTIAKNLDSIKAQITDAEKKHNREPGSVRLVGISKKQPMGSLKTAADEGLKDFAEIHLQEAVSKIGRLKNYNIEWHFIDAVQFNKAEATAKYFDWVHSIDRAKTALMLSEARPENMPPINLLIKVNIDDEPNKIGIAFEELPMTVDFIAKLPNIKLRGLTATPTKRYEFEAQREPFNKLREAFEELKQNGHPELDTLCMGMSHDFEAAIAEGATMVRIGGGIFGSTGN